ncbi:MAG: hypothetical protein HYU66_22175 [Armatimonadetes bacterium]|nr:hypothetical protein [Armatimonadota bacterium]
MAANPFEDAWGDLGQEAGDPRLAVLKQFAESIRAATGGRVVAGLKRGYVTNLGQEWRVVLCPSEGGMEVVLLRAHLPVGEETYLDLYDAELVKVGSPSALEGQLKAFAGSAAAKDNLRVLQQQ